MELRYDEEVNMAYVYLREPGTRGTVAKSVPWEFTDEQIRCELVLDFDSDGHFIGIEVFGARYVLLPSELGRASRTEGSASADE
jgi:uncharacterized protein YuzE